MVEGGYNVKIEIGNINRLLIGKIYFYLLTMHFIIFHLLTMEFLVQESRSDEPNQNVAHFNQSNERVANKVLNT